MAFSWRSKAGQQHYIEMNLNGQTESWWLGDVCVISMDIENLSDILKHIISYNLI